MALERGAARRAGYSGRGRPRSPLVDRREVVTAALEIIDLDGPEALSMRALAERLGLEAASSLYNHFANKGEIRVAVAQRIVADIPQPPPTESGSEWMVLALVAYRRALIAHPRAIGLVVEAVPRNFATHMFARAAAEMRANGVDDDRVVALLDAVEAMAVGSAIACTADRDRLVAADWLGSARQGEADLERRFELSCRALVDALYAPSGG